MQIRHKDGLPFSIYQIDLSEYSTVFKGGVVTFVGYRKDGTSINHTFTTDGVIDGTGPLVDFQTFLFPAGFSNLDRLVITTEGFMMDNLVVSPLGEETPLPPRAPRHCSSTMCGLIRLNSARIQAQASPCSPAKASTLA